MVLAAADEIVPALMPDVDPTTGLHYTPAMTASDHLFMYKVVATGAVTFMQCLFYKWRKWQRQLQLQRQQEEQQQAQQSTTLAIY